MQPLILLVEDDVAISDMVDDYLNKEGFTVVRAYDGEEAVRLFGEYAFDLILLDLMLPKLSGMDFLQVIRERSLIPILITSAKDGDVDKALGLGFGADDYIAKPFSMIELAARIKAAIRRATKYTAGSLAEAVKQPQEIRLDDLLIDLDNFSVSRNNQEIKLTAKEFHLLKLFAANPKKVFTKANIFRSVWEDDYLGDENVINVHMRRLREKIEIDPSKPRYILTLWGIGYKLGDF
ncbi:response regulator transcription factor [Paenibacillus sp. FJAT-26967]|uniref:response regulator transcription factor n=1 Tax=Paenibacillus sp. FJAT-26967 TaxID=1729690 RepID=UPI000837C4E3|nr:response regulator transcription factor [Paenibacillus sp. FJAT-26967]